MPSRGALEDQGMKSVAIPSTDSLVRSKKKMPEYFGGSSGISETVQTAQRIEGAKKSKGARNFHPR
jgi:hypothetical protein